MKTRSYRFSFGLIAALYFVFGFITWMNSVLIPFFKEICELSEQASYLVTFAFYISYFVMALPSSWILKKTGFANGMALGLVVMSIGAAIFIPAAESRSFSLFLIGLFTQGTGLALLQTAVNPYVTILGPIEKAAKRMSIMGVANKIAGMIGIFLFSALLFSQMTEISEKIASLTGEARELELQLLAKRIVFPYIAICISLLVLAVLVFMAHLPKVQTEESAKADGREKTSLFQYPYFWLGVLCLFLYVGVEVLAIDTLSLYGQYQGFSSETATKFGAFSLVALVLGYFVGIALIPKIMSQDKALALSGVLGLVFAVFALLTSGVVSLIFLILLSFAHAVMWPAIWPLAIENIGRHTATASAILIMAIAGGACIPLLYGSWVDAVGGNRQLPYLIFLPCYLYIVYYASKGHKVGK